jgi:hypothetical protein
MLTLEALRVACLQDTYPSDLRVLDSKVSRDLGYTQRHCEEVESIPRPYRQRQLSIPSKQIIDVGNIPAYEARKEHQPLMRVQLPQDRNRILHLRLRRFQRGYSREEVATNL